MRKIEINLSIEELKHLYWDEKLSCKEISELTNIKLWIIYCRLKEIGVLRNYAESMKIASYRGRSSFPKKRRDISNEEIKRLYIEENLGSPEIGKRLNCDPGTVRGRLKIMGCIRNRTDALKLAFKMKGKPPNYKGGRVVTGAGYIWVLSRDHKRANKGGYVFEHILVWEQYHQKPVPKGWLIHHINGIKSDNRPENLVAMKAGEHIHQNEPYKKRIRMLEIENRQLRQALEDSQMMFHIGEN